MDVPAAGVGLIELGSMRGLMYSRRTLGERNFRIPIEKGCGAMKCVI